MIEEIESKESDPTRKDAESKDGIPEIGRESDRIVAELRRMIITLELEPGSMVSELFLAKKLGCGRTPLREALPRLANEYLLKSVPKQGLMIAGLDLMDYMELIEALVSIEGFSARLAAERISEEALAQLDKIIQKAELASQEGDYSTVAQCDFDFHSTIGRATGNQYVSDTIDRMHRLATRYGYIGWKKADTTKVSLSEHHVIIDAIRQRDPDAAMKSVQEHTLNAKERIYSTVYRQRK